MSGPKPYFDRSAYAGGHANTNDPFAVANADTYRNGYDHGLARAGGRFHQSYGQRNGSLHTGRSSWHRGSLVKR
jgi:hypothetical protein